MDSASLFQGKSRHLTHQVSSKLEQKDKIQNLTLDNAFKGKKPSTTTLFQQAQSHTSVSLSLLIESQKR